jgi:P-type E1-E2 ATPase
VAVPVAMLSGISRCASRGVLVKGGAVLEALDRATLLFFDKTGTLTGGKARLVAIHPAVAIAPPRYCAWRLHWIRCPAM